MPTNTKQWLMVILAVIFFCGEACTHFVHPTRVSPGFQADVAVGVSNTYHPQSYNDTTPSQDAFLGIDTQIGLGYGWRFTDDLALLVDIQIPLAIGHEESAAGSTLDLFFQFLGKPIDLGMGISGSVYPGIYLQGGRSIDIGEHRIGFDIGFRFLFIEPGLQPFGLLSYQWKNLRVGLFVDYLFFPKPVNTECFMCDRSLRADDFVQQRLAGGIFFGFVL